MKDIFAYSIRYISTKFPSVFLKYLRKQLKTSELKNSSLYEITKIAHAATSVDELYKSIHENINKLMYAENMFIAIHDKEEDLISFPYYVDKYDNFEGTSFRFDDSLLTCNCILEGIPVLFSAKEMMDFLNATTEDYSASDKTLQRNSKKGEKVLKTKGTICLTLAFLIPITFLIKTCAINIGASVSLSLTIILKASQPSSSLSSPHS